MAIKKNTDLISLAQRMLPVTDKLDESSVRCRQGMLMERLNLSRKSAPRMG